MPRFLKIISNVEHPAPLWIATCLAMALQIQVTLFQSNSYAGLRINLADLLLPFLVPFILLSLFRKQSSGPRFESRLLITLLLSAAAMTLSMAQSYSSGGDNLTWAFVNKYIGFLILLAYLAIGAWLAADSPPERLLRLFSLTFCGFFTLTLILSLLALLGQSLTGLNLRLGNFAWEGFMANRNAFALLAMACLLLIESLRKEDAPQTHKVLLFLFWLLVPSFAVYNASRTGWIVGAVLIVGVLIKKPKVFLKKILPTLLLGALIAYGATLLYASRDIEKNIQFRRLLAVTALGEKVKYDGDHKRMVALEDGLELYSKSNLLIGAGLGQYKDFQIEKRGKFIDIIDCTPLWLLVETGLLGLLSFTVFFMFCLNETWKKGFSKQQKASDAADFQRAVFFFLLVFAAFSLFHEVMYTRFLWFILGLALGAKKMQARQNDIAKIGDSPLCN
ncbi:MAG: O-antigen ligase family protein [Alphaproteobacteria bacterium]|nr:O-antigen ligase family protein [Alphaproteobacteria bacterium]QQS57053.1 MAG: O-antigen ligase family protein [Alphaproteobacteria bacterium]